MGTRTLPREGREMGLKEIRRGRIEQLRREARRYSAEAVAEAIGVSRPYYAKLEANPSLVTMAQAEKLAEYFGVSRSRLFQNPKDGK